MSRHNEFNESAEARMQGNSNGLQNQYMEMQAPGRYYSAPAPYEQRMAQQGPTRNLPEMNLYTPDGAPIQGNRNGGSNWDQSQRERDNVYMQQMERGRRNNGQVNPESVYSRNAMDYMQMGPQQFANDLADGNMDQTGRKLEQRLRYMTQHGQSNDVIPFMSEVNRDLQAMGSPYSLTWRQTGNPSFPQNMRTMVTFHGRGSDSQFML